MLQEAQKLPLLQPYKPKELTGNTAAERLLLSARAGGGRLASPLRSHWDGLVTRPSD